MGKCIFRSSTCNNVSLVFISLVAISDVSPSWYPPNKPHDVQVQPPGAAGFLSSNAPLPICSAAQMDTHLASDKERAVILQWKKAWSVPSHPHEADCPVNRWYKDARGWHTIL